MPRIMEFLELNACILTDFFSASYLLCKEFCVKNSVFKIAALSKLFPTEFANPRAHVKSS